MKNVTIVKIDVCGSKKFSASADRLNPSIRREILAKLVEVSKVCFPDGDEEYPKGSFYKAEGDAVYVVMNKSSVALRGAKLFMHSWFGNAIPTYPDCRAVLDNGSVEEVSVPGKLELTGRPFENISVIEKEINDGKVYLTQDVLDRCDKTMDKFSFYMTFQPRPNDKIDVYWMDFEDPRTLADSSLIHALFVAHPKASEARFRIFELFIVECLLDRGQAVDMNALVEWGKQKHYPLPPQQELQRALQSASYVEETEEGTFDFKDGMKKEVLKARQEFSKAKDECTTIVAKSIGLEVNAKDAVDGIFLGELIDDYLAAVFGEVRMMANYFRSTLQFFDSGSEQFAIFDYVIRRHLTEKQTSQFTAWRRGFVTGLRQVCERNNPYVACVFHNVLATYYLNRSAQSSPYQIDKIKQRQIYLDTNVLYSLLVPASEFHDITCYFIERLAKMGVKIRVSHLTIQEYEESLDFVVKNYRENGANSVLTQRNPWLYQEYMSHPGHYLNDIEICRDKFSITKDLDVTEQNFDELDIRLQKWGMALERDWGTLPPEEVNTLWEQLLNRMTSNYWTYDRYIDFRSKHFALSVKTHDMSALSNLSERAEKAGKDALGPRVLYITTDSKMVRLRRDYPFIVRPQQFLEFILPYLFLSDVPLVDAGNFPNQLLSAQLGTLIVHRVPEMTEIVAAYMENPDLIQADPRVTFPSLSEDKAALLSEKRFKEIMWAHAKSDDAYDRQTAEKTSRELTALLDERRDLEREKQKLRTRDEAREVEFEELRAKVELLEKEKLKEQKRSKYWRAQARKK